MKQYRLFMLLASVFLLAGLNSCSHEEFSESTLQAVNEKGKKQGWTLARSDGGKWRIISEGY